jgi:clan AA aspartic protease
MIRGEVDDAEARIELTVRGPRRREQRFEAVIDTGYTGWLALPPRLVNALRLPWQSRVRGQLADGSLTLFDVFEANVVWNRREIRVPVEQIDADPLLGMAILEGNALTIEVRQGGLVTIKRLA